MKNFKIKSIFFSLMAIAMTTVFLSSCEQDYPSPILKNISNWEKVEINPTQLFEDVKKQEGGTINIDLKIENHTDWKFKMNEYKLATDDAREVMITENGEIDLPIPTSYFLYGTNTDGKKVLMAIYEDEFSMRILENGIESIIEPLANHTENAEANEYLFYSGRDVLNREEVTCGNNDSYEKRTSSEQINSNKKFDHYIKTSSLGDFSFYEKEKLNSWQFIRDNHFYGGARFWFYNNNATEVKYQYIGVYNSDVTVASNINDKEKYREEFRDFGNRNDWFPLNDVHIFYHNNKVDVQDDGSFILGRSVPKEILCKKQSDSYLWIYRLTDLNVRDNLFAHEIAHLLNMQHTDEIGLMRRIISSAIAQWSSNAQSNKFDKYLDDHGNCTGDN